MGITVEAVVTSVGYGDFLRETLPVNAPLLHNMVVMTSPDDDETISVCRRHSVHYVTSDDHTRDGPFNKARLINRGLDQIGGRGWILHLDADIVLPQKFAQMLDWAHVNERQIYGFDRQTVMGYDAWAKLRQHGAWDNHAHQCGWWFHPEFPVGSRWISAIHGFVPIGFAQLWHGSASTKGGYHARRYPITHGDAARTDVQFGLQWDRDERQLLPEVVVLHLESEPCEMGKNWRGRKTKRFGPMPGASGARDCSPSC